MSYQIWEAGEVGPGASSVADSGASVTALFREHHAELVRLAVLMTGDRASAEDIVQDVFTRLCARGQLPDPGDAVAYVRAKYGRTAVVRALTPASGGGRLGSGPVLLRQTAQFPYIVQALISPDGRTITAVVLTGRMTTSHGKSDVVPPNLSVIQLSRATGQLHVLYQRYLGDTFRMTIAPDVLQLSQDAAGQHWMLNGGVCGSHCSGGFNGWLRDGHLVPLAPVNGQEVSQAW